MAFQTYACNQYIKYLKQHKKECEKIYELILSSPFTRTKLGETIGMKHDTFFRACERRSLKDHQLITLLEFIK